MPDPMTPPADNRAFVEWCRDNWPHIPLEERNRMMDLAGRNQKLWDIAELRLDLAEARAQKEQLEHELQMSDQVISEERAVAASCQRTVSQLSAQVAERDATILRLRVGLEDARDCLVRQFGKFGYPVARAELALGVEIKREWFPSDYAYEQIMACREEYEKRLPPRSLKGPVATVPSQAESGIVAGLRKRIHQLQGHNQHFERCESAWCHPQPDNDPAPEFAIDTAILNGDCDTWAKRERGLREEVERLKTESADRLEYGNEMERRWDDGEKRIATLHAALTECASQLTACQQQLAEAQAEVARLCTPLVEKYVEVVGKLASAREALAQCPWCSVDEKPSLERVHSLLVSLADRRGKKLVVVMNHGPKMTRGKFAAQAVHAALFACGAHPETPVVVISGSQSDIKSMPIQIRDAGRTELEPGTLTAGATWIDEGVRFDSSQALPAGSAPQADPE